MNEKNPFFLDDIISHLIKNLIESAKINNEKIFVEILLSIRDKLVVSAISKSVYNYEKFILIPSQIYFAVPAYYRKVLIEIFTIRFTENISIINYQNNIDKIYVDKTYLGLIYLTRNILNENDVQNFKILFENLKQLSDFSFRENKENLYYHYSFIIVILSWIYYLYQNNKIDIAEYDLTYLENNFKNIYEEKEDIINIFNSLNKNSFHTKLWGIDSWEIEKPPIGESYFSLMPHTWLNFGFTLILLKFDLIFYQIDLSKIHLDDQFKFALNDITENIKIIESSMNKWNINDLDNRKNKIIQFYQLLKKREEIQYFEKVSKIPLSNIKINEFKQNVGKLWDNNSVIPQLLKHFNRVNFKENIFEKDGYGFFRTLLKSRFAFIDSDEHQNIYGLSSFGAQTAVEINNLFFRELISQKEPVQTKNLQVDVELFLSKLKDKSKVVIFSDWKGTNELKSENINYNQNGLKIPFSSSNYFKIPIINILDFSNYLFIVDLSCIDYTIYQKEEWYNEELLVEVIEPSSENIIEEVSKKENYKEENIEYTSEELEILEKNSVFIKVLFKHDMNVNDENLFQVFKYSLNIQ